MANPLAYPLVARPAAAAAAATATARQSTTATPRLPEPVVGIISSVAGGPGVGSALSVAQNPYYIALAGTKLYASDLVGNALRAINLNTGMESPVAGDGYGGFSGDGSPSSQSEINQPAGVATDGAGDVFFSDQDDQRVREIPAVSGNYFGINMIGGDVYTIAGDGIQGFSGDGGPADQAELALPEGIAVDSSGNVYIADTYNGRIREVFSAATILFGISFQSGDIYTVAGNGGGGGFAVAGDGGPAASAETGSPQGVNVDASGNIYITEDFNQSPAPVREVAATTHNQFGISMTAGDIYSVAGGTADSVCGQSTDLVGDGCQSSQAILRDPVDALVDTSGDLFISDYYDNRVREVTAGSGIISTYAGTGSGGYTGDGGLAIEAPLSFPTGLAIDGSGDLYVSDSTTVRIIDSVTSIIKTIAGDHTFTFSGDGALAANSQFGIATDVATDSQGNIYIPDAENNVVREVAAITHTQFGIAMTGGNIYTIAGDGYGVGGINGQGGFGGDGGAAVQALLSNPTSVAVDSAGDIYISDFYNHRIREINGSSGIISTVVGNGSPIYSGEGGPASQAALDAPNQVSLDSQGDLFIEDEGASRVLEVPVRNCTQFGLKMVAGDIYTIAGNGTAGFTGDGGPGSQSELDNPSGIALDNAGDLFIADRFNNRMRELSNAAQTDFGIAMQIGYIYTVAGDGVGSGFTSSGNGGPALDAALGSPVGAAVDDLGDLWFSDTNGHTVREVSSADGMIAAPVGNGSAGYLGDGGPASKAELSSPGALTFDDHGDLYFTDDFLKSGFGYNEVTGRVREVAVTTSGVSPAGMPLDVNALAGTNSAEVSWLSPVSDGGSPITGYLLASSPGNVSVKVGPGSDSALVAGLVSGSAYSFTVTAINSVGAGLPSSGSPQVIVTGRQGGNGYWMLDAAGNVYRFGSATDFGSATGSGDAVAIAATPDGNGYWLAFASGAVQSFGDAPIISIPGLPSGSNTAVRVVSIVATPDGNGYWMATSNGVVIWAGDAGYFGDASAISLNAPIVDMARTPDGRGYWLLAGDGGVFSYGDATFYGSTGNIRLNAPAIAMASTADGNGYWFVGSDGGVFAYGDAGYFGSMGGKALSKPVVGIVTSTDAMGYWMVASDGGVFAFGDAGFVGSLGGNPPSAPVVGFAAS